MDPVIAKIREELKKNADLTTQKSFHRFFKEEVKFYGVKTGPVVKIAKKYWSDIKSRDKQEIFELCEELYTSGYCEEAVIVSAWIPKLKDHFEPEDIAVFRHWIDSYINNWAACDGFCNHTMGDFIERFPEYTEDLKRWARSENRWMRRAAAVSLIVPAKRGKFLDDVFSIADLLLTDKEDIVQKGYGWLLKEASRKHQQEVFAYVMKNKREMPRTALRYAIELMPKDLKAEAMKKGGYL
ncbi:MAG: DNA alkylation repair protein [Methanoregula sp.]|nr:DNA alkylation repair protein [Methanoregula sp.]